MVECVETVSLDELCRFCIANSTTLKINSKPTTEMEIFQNEIPTYCEIAKILLNTNIIKIDQEDGYPQGICNNCSTKLIQFYEFKCQIECSQSELCALMSSDDLLDTDSDGSELFDEDYDSIIDETICQNELKNNSLIRCHKEDYIITTGAAAAEIKINSNNKEEQTREEENIGYFDQKSVSSVLINSETKILIVNDSELDVKYLEDDYSSNENFDKSTAAVLIKDKPGDVSTFNHCGEKLQIEKDVKLINKFENETLDSCCSDFNEPIGTGDESNEFIKQDTTGPADAIQNTIHDELIEHVFYDNNDDSLDHSESLKDQNFSTIDNVFEQLSPQEQTVWQKKLDFWIKKQSNGRRRLKNIAKCNSISSLNKCKKRGNKTSGICPMCNKQFSHKYKLKNHMNIHLNVKYECEKCQKLFSNERNLNEHVAAIHLKIKQFTCAVCSRVFNKKHTMVKHQRVHSSETLFQCTICPKSFKWKTSLDSHIYSHTGERPFKCHLCDKSYTADGGLRKHCQRFHAGLGMKQTTEYDANTVKIICPI